MHDFWIDEHIKGKNLNYKRKHYINYGKIFLSKDIELLK